MSKVICFLTLVAAVGGWLLVLSGGSAAAEKPAPAAEKHKLRAVVVVGGHGYDKKTFPQPFEGHEDITCEIREERPKGQPTLFADISNWNYDVIVLYNFNQKSSDVERANFLKLLDRGVGLVILHHAIAAYPDWDEYEKILDAKYCLAPMERNGVKYERSIYKHGVDIKVHVKDANHPITKGMSDFVINDETYGKWTYHGHSRVLLTTDNPLNTHELAWTRTAGKSRVFFCQLGHGPEAFADRNYKHLVGQGIRWASGRLGDEKPAVGEAKAADKAGK